jgi:hypothetical protein
MDLDELLRRWEAELRHRVGANHRLEAALGVSTCLSAMGRHREALERLEECVPKRPEPALLANWLNCRAYTLTMLNRAAEALVDLDDASVLVDDRQAAGLCLAGCITGTRGIADRVGHTGEAEERLRRASVARGPYASRALARLAGLRGG